MDPGDADAGGWRPRLAWRGLVGMGAAVLLAFVGYYTVCLLTPHDLPWHLSTSLWRVMTQLWPAFVLWAMLGINLP